VLLACFSIDIRLENSIAGVTDVTKKAETYGDFEVMSGALMEIKAFCNQAI
jgi:hypothetical protein